MKKPTRTPALLTALQAAQLRDCIAAGLAPPRVKMSRELNKGFSDMPLFAPQQTKLF